MRTSTKSFILFLIFLTPQIMFGQEWMSAVKSKNPTFFEIQKAFHNYWKDKPIEKGKGYKQFKRWEWYWEPRILPNGEFPSSSITWDEYQKYLKTHPASASKSMSSANWTFEGPSTTPGGYNGLGRINCIAFHPTNANTFWVGTPAGGLWKTTNGGSTWTTNTDNLPVLGISDIAIEPTNANIMYIATGDGDMGSLYGNGDTKSIGVLKSTDGGNTWNSTGMNWNVTSEKLIRRLIINPNNPQILIAAASDGIWRTTNGGATWTNVQLGYFMDLEFKPTDPSIVYASTYSSYNAYNAQIYRSTNSGISWTLVATLPGVLRIDLAVSANSPNLVDALCANTSGGLAGLWYSSNSGASFTQYFNGTTSNNLLHDSYNASGTGGQGHYDLAYVINPNNSNDIWLGGINTWNSIDGGSNWYLKTMWNSDPSINPNGVPTVHADKHFIVFHPLQSGTMFECNDGGIYKTTNGGASWTDISNGLQISQIYKIGVSQTITNNIICGLQDNGSREIYNNQWYEQTGGDGMECIIDYSNSNTEYASYANGKIYRTYDFWVNQTTISDNIPGQPQGAWVTPFVIHPTNPNILYAGYDKLYKTTDQGNSWTAISPVLTSDKLSSVAVAPSNTNTIYVATYDTLYLTTNGGTNWYYVPLGIPNAKISYITVDPTNSQKVYITLSGYSAGNKVYMSPDGGTTWNNYTGTLPNVPVNCIVYKNGSNEGLYIGTDVGVFYTDASMNDWISYQTGLPNVVVNELEISYNNNKLWAATFGRGLWSSDLYTPVFLVAQFTASPTTLCAGNTVNFTDQSTGSPTGWQWNFGDGSTSTLQNPSHTYNTAGTYTVSLTVTNATSSDTYTINNYITVNALPSTASAPTGTSTLCQDAANTTYTTIGAAYATSYLWNISPGAAGTISGTGSTATVNWNALFTGVASITVNGVNTCGNGQVSNSLSVTINPAPLVPVVTVNGNLLTSSAASGNQWYYNGSIIAGETSQTCTAAQSGSYYVVVTNAYGCSNTSAPANYNDTSPLPFEPELLTTAGDFNVYGNTTLSWSIGECLIETKAGTQAKLTQGFHQPSYVITPVSEMSNAGIAFNVFPNPASDNITVEILTVSTESFTLKMNDEHGKLLMTFKIKPGEKSKNINLKKYSKGMYFLNIYRDSGMTVKTYKIQKIY